MPSVRRIAGSPTGCVKPGSPNLYRKCETPQGGCWGASSPLGRAAHSGVAQGVPLYVLLQLDKPFTFVSGSRRRLLSQRLGQEKARRVSFLRAFLCQLIASGAGYWVTWKAVPRLRRDPVVEAGAFAPQAPPAQPVPQAPAALHAPWARTAHFSPQAQFAQAHLSLQVQTPPVGHWQGAAVVWACVLGAPQLMPGPLHPPVGFGPAIT
jgi:hypothetical protein